MGESQEAMPDMRLRHCKNPLAQPGAQESGGAFAHAVPRHSLWPMPKQDWLPMGHLGTAHSYDGEASIPGVTGYSTILQSR